MSREHVLPRWLRDAVRSATTGHHILGIDRERVREWAGAALPTIPPRLPGVATRMDGPLEDDTRPISGR